MAPQYRYGTLTRMMPERSFFFIRDDESTRDIFTHISAFVGKVALPRGTRVQFRLVPNSRKPGLMMAADVEPVAIVGQHGVTTGGSR